jgi:hypothetical protein
MDNRFSDQASIWELQEIGAAKERYKTQDSRIEAEIKSILDEFRSIKGQTYENARRGRPSIPHVHVL